MSNMSTGTLLLVLSPIILISLILAAAVIVSVTRKDVPWREKWPWLLLALINIFGPIFYFLVGSRILDEKAHHDQGE